MPVFCLVGSGVQANQARSGYTTLLTKKQIEKYRAIYLKVFGKEVSYEQALKEGSALVDLVQLVTTERKNIVVSQKFPDNNIKNNNKKSATSFLMTD